MNYAIHNAIINFIWGIADDVLRDVYVRGIQVPEAAEEERLALNNDTAETDDRIEDEAKMEIEE